MTEQIHLLPHQRKALEETKSYRRCAYYHAMGLGKTYTGSEKLMSFNLKKNLIVCQLSKVGDWVEHMRRYYDVTVYDLTQTRQVRGKKPEEMFELDFERWGLLTTIDCGAAPTFSSSEAWGLSSMSPQCLSTKKPSVLRPCSRWTFRR